jgi:hypothetical protein
MADITNNSNNLTGIPAQDDKLKELIDKINQIIQDELIDSAEALEEQASILTATGIWLDLWGKRLDYKRPYLPAGSKDVFGFDGNGVGFDQAIFHDGSTSIGVLADDDVYRRFLIARAGQLVTDGTVDDLTAILQAAYGEGSVYIDNGNMTLTVIISDDTITLSEFIYIAENKLLTKPAGVKIGLQMLIIGQVFGFDGNGVGFDQGSFPYIIF